MTLHVHVKCSDWQEGAQTCKDFALFMYLFCNLKCGCYSQKKIGLKVIVWGWGKYSVVVFLFKSRIFKEYKRNVCGQKKRWIMDRVNFDMDMPVQVHRV